LDKETGLYYFRARYYSGSLGRFIGRDPSEYIDGYSLYGAYFIPNGSDPFGDQAWHDAKLRGPVGNTDLTNDGITCSCEDCPCPPNLKGTQKVVCKAAPKFDIQIDVKKLEKMNTPGWTVNTTYNHELQHVTSLTAEIEKLVKERNDTETNCLSPPVCKTRAANAQSSLKLDAKKARNKESKHENPGSPKDGVPGAESPAAPAPTPPTHVKK
jgi:RHS repeat-associated protein